MTPLALPCKLMIPTKGQAQSRLLLNILIKICPSFRSFFRSLSVVDPNEEALELATPTDPVVELLKQGAGERAEPQTDSAGSSVKCIRD